MAHLELLQEKKSKRTLPSESKLVAKTIISALAELKSNLQNLLALDKINPNQTIANTNINSNSSDNNNDNNQTINIIEILSTDVLATTSIVSFAKNFKKQYELDFHLQIEDSKEINNLADKGISYVYMINISFCLTS